MSVECPECGEVERVRVLETRTRDSGIVDRRHECGRCGARFKSLQLPPKSLTSPSLQGAIRRYEKLLDHAASVKMKDETRNQMMAMRLAGTRCQEIARIFGVSVHMARYYTRLPRQKLYPNARKRT